MWHSCTDPFSKSEPVEWHPYSDMDNMMIEEAFKAGTTHAMMDDYRIDFEHNLHISNNDVKNQHHVKRMLCSGNEKHVRSERFLSNPVAPKRPYGDQYGFISPFIKEVAKGLNLSKEQLPSKNETIVSTIVEKAALGIIEEGEKIGKQREAEQIAKMLMEKKEEGMKEVWKRCALLYTMTSFLYAKTNEIMRVIGSEEHEEIWRSKILTFGPFCLLLWDNPFDRKAAEPGTILYRGTQLSDDMIACFQDDCSKDPKPLCSFQAFTSCTRNRNVAEMFGNVLLIMTIRIAFTIDLEPYSNYVDEEEELLLPEPDKHKITKNFQQPTEESNTDVYYDLYRYRADYYASRDLLRGDDDRRALSRDNQDGVDYDWD
ncbi:unnamed protein product [Adineta steineri]|uniref:NAD(P)(+)--arginine ADP-ribosyltransferase n=1 Tax=Adineta steineri TaxID=433720 RepID=A0A813PEH4_9BILA|nr:unnamed protein product [Adineta steineri]CAF3756740.1 unnamed protein product [Adineta steineri]